MLKNIAVSLALAAAASWLGACAQTARYVTAEHWHDDNAFFIAYTEYTKTNFIVASSGSSTAHVMMCRAGADNTATCRPQVAIDRLLNPGEAIADPPPAPVEALPTAVPPEPPAAAPAPEGAPAPQPTS